MPNSLTLSMIIGAALGGSFNAAFSRASNTVGRLGENTQRLTRSQATLNRIMRNGFNRSAEQTRRLSELYQRNRIDLERLTRTHESLNRSLARGNQLGEERQRVFGELQEQGAKFAAMALPVAGSIVKAANFQDQIKDISITGGFDTATEARVGATVRQAALKFNQTTDDINQGLAKLVNGGINSAKDLELYAPKIAKFATATRSSMDDVGDLTIALKDNLNISAQGFDRSMNMLAAAGKAGQFEVKNMAKVMPNLSAAYRNLGLDGEEAVLEIGAALQIARKGAGSGEEAANNFSNFLGKLTSEDTKKSFQDAGINIEESMKQIVGQGKTHTEAMLGVIEKYLTAKSPKAAKEYVEALDIADARKREHAVQKLVETYKLGELFNDQQTLAFIKPMLANKERFAEIKAETQRAAGEDVVGKDFDNRMQSPTEQWKQAKITLGELALSIGESLLPALLSVVNAAIPVLGFVADLAQRNQDAIKTVFGLMAGFTGLRMGIVIYRLLRVGVVSLGESFVTNFLKIKGNMQLFRIWLRSWPGGTRTVGQAFASLRGRLLSVFGAIRTGAMALWGRLGSASVRAFGLMRTGLRWLGAQGVRLAMQFGRSLLVLGRFMMANPIVLVLTAIAIAGYLIYRNWETIGPVVKKVWESLKAGYEWVKTKTTDLIEFFAKLPGKLADAGRNMITGLINGIQQKWNDLKATVSGMATSVVNWFKNPLDIQSPSRVFMGFGHNIAIGAALGIDKGSDQAIRASDAMARRIADTRASSAALSKSGVNTASGGAHTIHFSPTIHVNGGSGDIAGQVQAGLQSSYTEFQAMMRRYEADKARRAFA